MKSVSVSQLRDQVILNLYNRIVSDKLRNGATTSILLKDLGSAIQKGFLQIVIDDLMDRKFVRKDDAGRYGLTASGIEHAQRQWGFGENSVGAGGVNSVAWTGDLNHANLSAAGQQQLVARLRDIQVVVESLNVSQSEREQVRAHVVAAIVLAEAPEPPWQVILTILTILASVSAIASAVTDVLSIFGSQP